MNEKEDSLEVKIELRRKLEDLVSSPGWDVLKEIADGQVAARRNRVMLTPVSTNYSVETEQFEKGEVAGVLLFLDMPQTAIEGLIDEIEMMREREDMTDE